MIDYRDGHLTVRAIKKQIDGALGSRGAWLLAPYADKPESSGLETTKVAEIDETARIAMQNGFQLWSQAFNKAYVGVMRDTWNWWKGKEIAPLLQVTDEPRETEINDWNHNRVDCIRLLKLAREVPGMQTMISMMGDNDCFNRPYTPLVSPCT